MTRNHDFPGAQVEPGCCAWSRQSLTPLQAMLYAAGVPDPGAMKNNPHVGVASVWWEGNPCNMHREHNSSLPASHAAKLIVRSI